MPLGQAVKNWGQLGAYGAGRAGSFIKGVGTGQYGATAASLMYGTAAGGAYGAYDQDTSILGGMAGGAAMGALGAAGYRYGSVGAGAYGMSSSFGGSFGKNVKAGLYGMRGQMLDDAVSGVQKAQGATLRANNAVVDIGANREMLEPVAKHASGALMKANEGLGRIESTLKGWNQF